MDRRSDSGSKTILITRFSAVGDIAMTIPLLYSLCKTYPSHRFVFVSRERFGQFFIDKPGNLDFIGVNLDDYKGIHGLYRLYRELSAQKPYMFADLHDVLRTKILRIFFKFSGTTRIASIDKGRREKKALTKEDGKQKRELKSTFERYRDVFTRLGLPFEPDFKSLFKGGKGNIDDFIGIIRIFFKRRRSEKSLLDFNAVFCSIETKPCALEKELAVLFTERSTLSKANSVFDSVICSGCYSLHN